MNRTGARVFGVALRLALVGFALAGTSSLRALVLVDTLGTAGAAQINKSSGASATFDAVMFDLSGATMTISSVSFMMKTNTLPGSTWIAGVFKSSTSSTAPTAFVADLGTFTSTSTSFVQTTFTPGAPIDLQSGFRYWLVFGSTTSGQQGAYSNGASPANASSESGILVFTGAESGLAGRWRSATQNTLDLVTLSGITLTGGTTTTSYAPLFQVNGTLTSIPEPSTYGIAAGVVVLGLAALRRRRS